MWCGKGTADYIRGMALAPKNERDYGTQGLRANDLHRLRANDLHRLRGAV